jgi:hypothetical protein
MKNPFNTLLSLIGFGSSADAKDIAPKEGECWLYSTRPGEEASFLVIRKIETLPKLGEVVFISVFGTKMEGSPVPAGVTVLTEIHIPIAGANLRSSLKKRVRKRIPIEVWQEAYRFWREAYDSGKGGIYTMSVSECVSACVSASGEALDDGRKA